MDKGEALPPNVKNEGQNGLSWSGKPHDVEKHYGYKGAPLKRMMVNEKANLLIETSSDVILRGILVSSMCYKMTKTAGTRRQTVMAKVALRRSLDKILFSVPSNKVKRLGMVRNWLLSKNSFNCSSTNWIQQMFADYYVWMVYGDKKMFKQAFGYYLVKLSRDRPEYYARKTNEMRQIGTQGYHLVAEIDNLGGFVTPVKDTKFRELIIDWVRKKHGVFKELYGHPLKPVFRQLLSERMQWTVDMPFEEFLGQWYLDLFSHGTVRGEKYIINGKRERMSKTQYFGTRTPHQCWIEFLEMLSDQKPLRTFPVQKLEMKRVRAIANTSIKTHYCMCYLYTVFKTRAKTVLPNSTITASDADMQGLYLYRHTVRGVNVTLDQSKFDHNARKWMIKDVIASLLGRAPFLGDVRRFGLLDAFDRHEVILLEGESVVKLKHQDGVQSGWKMTSIFDTLINDLQLQSIETVLFRTDPKFYKSIYKYFQGDDIDLSYPDQYSAEAVVNAYPNTGLIIKKEELIMDWRRSEFLRHYIRGDEIYAYPARSIPGMLVHKPWSQNFLKDSQSDASAMASVGRRSNRLKGKLLILSMLSKDFTPLDHKPKWFKLVSLMQTPTLLGGFGLLRPKLTMTGLDSIAVRRKVPASELGRYEVSGYIDLMAARLKGDLTQGEIATLGRRTVDGIYGTLYPPKTSRPRMGSTLQVKMGSRIYWGVPAIDRIPREPIEGLLAAVEGSTLLKRLRRYDQLTGGQIYDLMRLCTAKMSAAVLEKGVGTIMEADIDTGTTSYTITDGFKALNAKKVSLEKWAKYCADSVEPRVALLLQRRILDF